MDFLDLAKSRYSVRSYSDREIEPEKLDKILQAAMAAPTAVNYQPQKIYMLKSKEALEKIRSVSRCAFNAPVVFIICADISLSWRSPFKEGYDSSEMDASIVCSHMMLEAADLGLGSVWVLLFDPEKLKKEFNLPDNIKPLCLLPVGYPAQDAAPSERHFLSRSIEELVTLL